MSLAQHIPAEFPLAGSHAWLAPEEGRPKALPVTIIQHDRRDRSVYVAQRGRIMPGEEASSHRRVAHTELYASEAEAIGEPCKTCRGSGQRKRNRKGLVSLHSCATCAGSGRLFPKKAGRQ